MSSGERPAQGDVSTHGDLYAPAAELGSLLERAFQTGLQGAEPWFDGPSHPGAPLGRLAPGGLRPFLRAALRVVLAAPSEEMVEAAARERFARRPVVADWAVATRDNETVPTRWYRWEDMSEAYRNEARNAAKGDLTAALAQLRKELNL